LILCECSSAFRAELEMEEHAKRNNGNKATPCATRSPVFFDING